MSHFLTEVFGWTGALLVLGAYFLVSTGKATGSSNLFQYLNIAGAACLIIYTFNCQAYASFAVNAVWVLIGFRAMYMETRSKKFSQAEILVATPPPVAAVELENNLP